jgi:hypothetical protein
MESSLIQPDTVNIYIRALEYRYPICHSRYRSYSYNIRAGNFTPTYMTRLEGNSIVSGFDVNLHGGRFVLVTISNAIN